MGKWANIIWRILCLLNIGLAVLSFHYGDYWFVLFNLVTALCSFVAARQALWI